jgi:hypothetical protein
MSAPPNAKSRLAPAPSAQKSSRTWLLFVHQLPPTPSNLRVQTWRRLQQVGAIPRKQSVYVLPDTPSTREDFEWLATEVKAAGGDAEVFVATTPDNWASDALVEDFRRVRQDAYSTLVEELERALQRIVSKRRGRSKRAPSVNRLRDTFRQRLAALERIDFFGSAGRDRALQLLAEFESRIEARPGPHDDSNAARSAIKREDFQGRLWVTRPRPGVDRMASAWLIRRFIDPHARFGFAADRAAVQGKDVAFDMFGVEFSHHADRCTFETLCVVFGIGDEAVTRIAEIVHDLDLKDGRFSPAEASTVEAMIEGLQLANADDERLLSEGMTLFESLYRSFAHAARLVGPRPVARQHPKRKSRKRQ